MFKKENDLEQVNTEQKFLSLSEFRNLRAFPDTKPLILINLDFVIEYANRPFLSIFNIKEGDSISSLKSEPSISLILENLIGKRYSSFHLDLYLHENSYEGYFVEIERILIGTKNFFVITFDSIAERKRIEEKINNLHYALEYGYLPVITFNDKGLLNYSTDSFEKLLGQNIQQLYGKHVSEILTNILREEDQKELVRKCETKETWKAIVTPFKGKKIFYEFILKPIVHYEGRITGYILTANDITDHILRLRIIEKTEKRQRLILNSISEPLVIIRRENKKFVFENANEVFFNAFGVNSEDVVENDFLNFPDEELADTLLTAIDRLLNDDENVLEIKFTHSGTKKDYMCKLSAFKVDFDDSVTFVISFFDITAQLENEKKLRNAYEKEMKLNKLKSAFMANMSHEIRTPLNAIIGYADLLHFEAKEKNDESILELTTYLIDGAKRLVKLVENIIDVSRIESGEFEFNFEKTDIARIFEKLAGEFNESAKIKNISLEFDISENARFLETDTISFEKLFWELLDNAIKYNIENGKVIVRAFPFGEFVRIEITDTGRGISREMLDEVLQPFTQDSLDGYTRHFEGAGLGLTFAHKITKTLGGEFHIESEQNHGTKITVTFPKKRKNK